MFTSILTALIEVLIIKLNCVHFIHNEASRKRTKVELHVVLHHIFCLPHHLRLRLHSNTSLSVSLISQSIAASVVSGSRLLRCIRFLWIFHAKSNIMLRTAVFFLSNVTLEATNSSAISDQQVSSFELLRQTKHYSDISRMLFVITYFSTSSLIKYGVDH